MNNKKSRPTWSNSLGFVLAAAGSAVGLGNIWKFPYIVGSNGGGAFVLVYLACVVGIGIPLLISELFIGQRGRANAVVAYENVHRPGTPWKLAGWFGLLSAFLILSFYSVVGGWILDFVYRSLAGEFSQLSPDGIKELLLNLFQSPWRLGALHFLFSSMGIAIVLGGVQKGLERWNKILMPALVVILVMLCLYSCFLPGFGAALKFLFYPDFSALRWASLLEAAGHACFTLSVTVGVMITYGSYLKPSENIAKMSIAIASIDTILALISGVVVFSAVFSYDISSGTGPTLIFQTLPILFAQMPGGYFVAILFFLFVTFTALTSSISILEVVVAYCEETFASKRRSTTIAVGYAAFLLGILSLLSFNVLADVKVFGLGFFDLFDKLTSKILMPLSGLLTTIFCGWVLSGTVLRQSVDHPGYRALGLPLLFCVKIATPTAIILVLWLGLD